ncbi:phosphoenolpyruvate-protein phosphotransferase [Neoasaia chiangmaiensis NBRC 101099]|uniref:Phosphoenolpyruvate-protein phosphotransferase n=2 Tax=Neoasaia chiangmaiensis TaxID=320497 RepID=A0A1U9KPS5_9PROT|nr:phosphoenolpyruvate--protein phosphotransferase [Neoasaia chiangmaiensis]AQS87778.1 phosphoenolpyruvate--protein phosphotransferase [Neoasaia chiangmaiensis]GBR41582.1 phosphoenolpyruvate-protein phosphotransferase [Neoasaia chiangmaiensis NBRC 101099]GEN14381.1 phosphoenolpyruvate-protein phosphotransferase [Neoasaia chiangmaiensis]
MRRLHGRSVSAGIVIANVALVQERPLPTIGNACSADTPESELARLDNAITQTQRQITKLRTKLEALPEEGREEIGALLDVYERMLGHSRLIRTARARIAKDRLTAEAAVQQESETLAALAGPKPNTPEEEREAAARRAGEFREIARRLLRNLTGVSFRAFSNLPVGCILAAEQLRPADAALIDPTRIAAVLSEGGGATDHTAIMLRALNVPAVLAVTDLTSAVQDGDLLIVDGARGEIVVNPDPATLAEAQAAMAAEAQERKGISRLRRLPARLTGGEDIELLANVELPAELPLLRRNGAQGIGLLRSEFLFDEDREWPDEMAQYAVYAGIVRGMDGLPTTIRVLDWGGEKGLERLRMLGYAAAEDGGNPALGMRGLRLLLHHPEILLTQFSAILRASMDGPVRVLLPMVTATNEIVTARELFEKAARRLRRKGVKLPSRLPPLGIMVETPAAAMTADALVQHADFLAIGTNDLTMYTLAVDRAMTMDSDLYSPLHPAVLRLIATTVNAALRGHRPVCVCGELAADPHAVALLIGMGLRSFSMTASALPPVKKLIRALSLEECDTLRRQAMLADDPPNLRAVVRNFRG